MTAQDPYRPQMQPPAPAQGYAAQQQGWPQPPHAYAPQHPGFAPYPAPWPPAPAAVMVDGFYLFQPRLKPIPSGQAIGSLIAGIGGILAALPGLLAAAFSPWTGITFFALAALLGGGSMLLASYAKRQMRASDGGVSGRGLATTGLILGIIASSLAGITILIAIASM